MQKLIVIATIFLALAMFASAQQFVASSATNPTNSILPGSSVSPTIPTIPPAPNAPQWNGDVRLLSPDGAFAMLEEQVPSMLKEKAKLTARSGHMLVTFVGITSPAIVSASPEFVARLAPNDLVSLDKLTIAPDANLREFTVTKTTSLRNGNPVTVKTSEPVDLRFANLGDMTKFTPVTPLTPGEYVVYTKSGKSCYLFSVR